MRISKMITKEKCFDPLSHSVLSTNSLTKCMEISLENLYSKIILSFKGLAAASPDFYRLVSLAYRQADRGFWARL